MPKTIAAVSLSSLHEAISEDDYLFWVDSIHVLSVFDDIKYDRSDIDILSPAMRRYTAKFLKNQGYHQKSGQCFASKNGPHKLWMPKPSVLGASPFDITRYISREENDAYILTPTQTAAYLLDTLTLDTAVKEIALLIEQQPINLLKLRDHIPKYSDRNRYAEAFPYLRYCQRQVIENPRMRFKRSLGSVF